MAWAGALGHRRPTQFASGTQRQNCHRRVFQTEIYWDRNWNRKRRSANRQGISLELHDSCGDEDQRCSTYQAMISTVSRQADAVLCWFRRCFQSWGLLPKQLDDSQAQDRNGLRVSDVERVKQDIETKDRRMQAKRQAAEAEEVQTSTGAVVCMCVTQGESCE